MTQPSSAPSNAPGVFSRQASGLIRVGSGYDVFIFNVGLVSIGIAIGFNQLYGPALYPGAQPWLSTVIAALGMMVVAATFYLWSTIFPRSGGVYVVLSRTTHPALAFVWSVLETMIVLYYAAYAAGLIVQVGLSSFFSTVGLIAKNSTLTDWGTSVSGKQGVFWLGTLFLVLAGVLVASGTRRYFSFQRILFAIAVIGTLVILGAMLFGSRSSFSSNLTDLTGLKYNDVIAAAEKNGYATHAFSWEQSWKFIVFPLLPLLGAVQSVGIGGEIKKVSRTQLVGMLGAVAATGTVIAIFAVLSDKDFGYNFQGALAYNSLTGVTDGSTATTPWFTVLAGILTSNVFLSVIIMGVFAIWIWFWVPAEIAYSTRSMLAWSFDRVAPDRLGYVSERTHTPVVAIGLSTTISIVFMWFIAFKAVAFLTLVEVLLVIWGTVMIAAVIFPVARRRMFEGSPAARIRVAGVPLLSILGFLSTAFFVAVIWLLWDDPNAAGALINFHGSQTSTFWIVVGTLIGAVAWYVGTRIYRRRQGINLDLAFAQIPIE